MAIRYLSGIDVDSNTLFVDDANNRVGIGTASPTAPFNVFSSSVVIVSKFENNANAIQINIGDSSNTQYSNIFLETNSGQGEIFKAGSAYSAYGGASALNIYNSNGPIAFHPNNTANAMFIANTGNVGIGTTVPGEKLHVVGNIYSSGNITANGNINATSYLQTYGIFYHRSNFYVLNKAENGWLTWVTRSTSEAETTIQLDYVRSINASNGGNVGIGTTNPTDKLTIQGTSLKFYTTQNVANQYTYIGTEYSAGNGNNKAEIRFAIDGADTRTRIQFHTANGGGDIGERMRITYDGNVGIGTTSPTAKLDVIGVGRILIPDTPTTTGVITAKILGYSPSPYGMVFRANASGTNSIQVQRESNDSEIFALTLQPNGGNVGIGTTSPLGPLEVYKSAPGALGGHIIINNDGTAVGNETALMFGDGGINAIRAAISSTTEGSPYLGELRFKSGATGYSGLTTNMIIKGNGNVGIGTTSPSYKLQVAEDTYARIALHQTTTGAIWNWGNDGSNMYAYYTNTGVRALDITNNGNVGIGTTSPTRKLSILETGTSFQLRIGYSNDYYYDFGRDPNDGYFDFYGNQTGYIGYRFGGADGTRLAITPSGNVGIGTTSPTDSNGFGKALDLSGTTGSSLYVRHSNSGTYGFLGQDSATTYLGTNTTPLSFYVSSSERMRITSGGNVLIGTTTDAGYKLYVNGSTRVTGNIETLSNIKTQGYLLFDYDGDFTGGNYYTMEDHVDGYFRMGYAFNSNLVISTDGNIGIGTTAPGAKLQITTSGYDTGTSGFRLTHAEETKYVGFAKLQTPAGDPIFSLGTIDDGTTFETLSMINGNVGIGTTNPGFRLDVAGPVSDWATRFYSNASASAYFANGAGYGGYIDAGTNASSSTYLLSLVSNGSTRVYVSGDGNVGIGTTTINERLDVEGNMVLRNSSTYSTSLIRDIIYRSSTASYGNQPIANLQFATVGNAQSEIRFITRSTPADYAQRMVINKIGNVGIGTTNPGYKLDVAAGANGTYPFIVRNAGNVEIGGIYSSSAGAGQIYLFNASTVTTVKISTIDTTYFNGGNVGIGTTNPIHKLEVAGNISINGGTYLDFANGDVRFVNSSGLLSVQTYSVSTGLSTKMVVTGNGNVGIGATDFSDFSFGSSILKVAGSRATLGLRSAGSLATIAMIANSDTTKAIHMNLISTGQFSWYQYSAGGVTFSVSAAGNTLLGTETDAGYKLYVNGTGYFNGVLRASVSNTFPIRAINPTQDICRISFQDSANSSNDAVWVGSNGFDLALGAGYEERMRINSSGFAGIATFPSTDWTLSLGELPGGLGSLDTTSSIRISYGALGVGVNPSATIGRIDASNDIVAYSTSDSRLKENVTPIANALDKVKSLTGVEFDWKEETKDVHGYEGHDVGVIAQEVQAVLPEAIRTNDTGYLSVRYEKMIALLIEGIKEQQNQIDELKAKLDGLTK